MTLGRQFRLRSFSMFSHTLEKIPVLSPRADHARFCVATRAEAERMRDYEDGVFSRAQVFQKLEAGEKLYMIFVGERVAWLAWSRTGLFLHVPLRQWLQLPPRVADVFGVFTVREFRNMGLARFGYGELLRHLKAAGCQRAVLQVEHGNVPSLKAVGAAGFAHYADLSYLRLALLRLYRYQPVAGRAAWHWAVRTQTDRQFNAMFEPAPAANP